MSEPYRTPAAPLRAIVEELADGGVRAAVICPGSRSTPLALALQAAPQISTWVHLDERAAAFFALGLAKAARAPVVVLGTSGTAVVNFAPAVAEARYGHVPLIALTADRPPELQGVGAPQTIDQVELYGRHVKWYAGLPVPEASEAVETEIRNAVARAVDVATAVPAGPVQLNMPFREPLLPVGALVPEPVAPLPPAVSWPRGVPAHSTVEGVITALAAAQRPLIVCGPLDVPGAAVALGRLATLVGAPLLADGLSNVRNGRHDRRAVIAHHDVLLRSERFAADHRPDFVLRFGARPTSKALGLLLDGLTVPQLLVDPAGGWNVPAEPSLVPADPAALAEAVLEAWPQGSVTDPGPSEWLRAWRRADDIVAAALCAWFDGLDEPFEGVVARALDAALPDGALVLAGNSMPVRDIDAFMPSSGRLRRTLGNRGANGIDGLLSTALGLSAAVPEPVVAVLGDISFIHDLNALVAAHRLDLTVTIVLVDNNGGGIFSFLPQADADLPEAGLPEHYETLFGTPHGLDLGLVATALGARHQHVEGASLAAALAAAVGRPGVDVLHLRTERSRNVELHGVAQAVAITALEAGA